MIVASHDPDQDRSPSVSEAIAAVTTREEKSMTMVERVARALFEADAGGDPEWDYTREARAAIEAMREPSEAMLDGLRVSSSGWSDVGNWQAMIDAALSEQSA